MKPSSFIDVGTKAKTIISDLDKKVAKKKFYSSCQKSFIASASYLQNNPLLNNKIIKYCSILQVLCISDLCLKIVKVFGSKALKIFELPLDSTKDFIVDIVRRQWKINQLEHITESMYMAENKKVISPILTGIISREAYGRK